MSGPETGPQGSHRAMSDAAARQHPGQSRTTTAPSSSYAPAVGRSSIPDLNGNRPDAASYPSPGVDRKTLVVGRDISLNGQIKACDKLVVEGNVEADLNESQIIEIARHGCFKGTAVIDEADISGCFEGNLTVRKHLVVRSTGRIYGTLTYSRLEIEAGGEISGNINVLPSDTDSLDASPPCGPAPAVDDLKEHTTQGAAERQQAR